MRRFVWTSSLFLMFSFFFINNLQVSLVFAEEMAKYNAKPPFVESKIPPLILINLSKSHKLFTEAYPDSADLDGDGKPELGYKHSITYYGYFDPYKCYKYDKYKEYFYPVRKTNDKYCNGNNGEWSGNFLNWLTMSRFDLVKKVLYGGYRDIDKENITVLRGTFIPQDAHSWGKEYDKGNSDKLTPYKVDICCELPTKPSKWNKEGKILFVIYDDTKEGIYGKNHEELIQSFSTCNLKEYKYLSKLDTTNDYSETNRIETGNYILVTEFLVRDKDVGVWKFAIDSDDGSELEIDGKIVASYYGGHGFCRCKKHRGKIYLNEGWHRVIVRLRENHGGDGVLVWFKKPGQNKWEKFSSKVLDLSAPEIINDCSIKTTDFILTGEPSYATNENDKYIVKNRLLFCVVSTKKDEPPKIRVLESQHRIWEWASKERPVCDNSLGRPEEFYVRVKVCDPEIGLEDNCKKYPAGTYKPIGLIQKFGEPKLQEFVWSKTLESCKNYGEFDSEKGFCIEKNPIYFGLLTGSYSHNLEGGVLRRHIWDLRSEINSENGIFKDKNSVYGSLIDTINNLKIINFDYSGKKYKCGWITDRPIRDGECVNWGNPLAEMFYESIRYLLGFNNPIKDFSDNLKLDEEIGLPSPRWQIEGKDNPVNKFPQCAKKFILTISDIYNNFDTNKIPGSAFSSWNAKPSFDTALHTNEIGSLEDLNNKYLPVGETKEEKNFVCTPKKVEKLSEARGICPLEPGKQGGFYLAGLAYEAYKDYNIKSYYVVFPSPSPQITLNVGGKRVSITPIGKSVTGCLNVKQKCWDKCSIKWDKNSKKLEITNCSKDAYCPSNQIVDFYIEKIVYDENNNIKEVIYRINFEDLPQGADYDMDALVKYHIQVLDKDHIKVSLQSEYAAGCIGQVLGFTISGTTEDGVWLVVRDADTSIDNIPTYWEKVFTVKGSEEEIVQKPIWYAAKWGGFKDLNGNNIPDLIDEWDKNLDGQPDNYFYVNNFLDLERKLEEALKAILLDAYTGTSLSIPTTQKRSSGTALNSAHGVILQALLQTEKTFKNENTIKWLGQFYTWWFYNKKINKTLIQNIREDTNGNKMLDVSEDLILEYKFENNQLILELYQPDKFGAKISENPEKITNTFEDLTPVIDFGKKLLNTLANNRKIYTSLDGKQLIEFTADRPSQYILEKAYERNIFRVPILGIDMACLNACDYFTDIFQPWDAWNEFIDCITKNNYEFYNKLINWVRGVDYPGFRSRKTDGVCNNDEGCTENIWKLGDIDYSSPVIVNYGNYLVAFVGANDGMLHAFKIGYLKPTYDLKHPVKILNDKSSKQFNELGEELWSYIPFNVLPYLAFLARTDYSHIYTVDLKPYLIETKDGRKILIGGLRLGGATESKDPAAVTPPNYTCPTSFRDILKEICKSCGSWFGMGGFCNSILTPEKDYKDCYGLSSYFALDVTDPKNPKLLWEIPNPDQTWDLNFAYSGPAVVYKNDKIYLIFGKGPINYEAYYEGNEESLKFYVVNLNTGNIETVIDTGIKNAFSGRLFTKGLDVNNDNQTDYVLVGYSRQVGDRHDWKGGLLMIDTRSTAPSGWTVRSYLRDKIPPITAKIEVAKCGRHYYAFFGTGRWFYKLDNPLPKQANILYGLPPLPKQANILYGLPIICVGTDCHLQTAAQDVTNENNATKVCLNPAQTSTPQGWYIELETKPEIEGCSLPLKERVITDPTYIPVGDMGIISFTTTVPCGDLCAAGSGYARVWLLNCANGASLSYEASECNAYQIPKEAVPEGSLLLQTSTATITAVSPKELVEKESRYTEWFAGVAPESATPFFQNVAKPPVGGKIILWLEY